VSLLREEGSSSYTYGALQSHHIVELDDVVHASRQVSTGSLERVFLWNLGSKYATLSTDVWWYVLITPVSAIQIPQQRLIRHHFAAVHVLMPPK
jgi:hypothetical protein